MTLVVAVVVAVVTGVVSGITAWLVMYRLFAPRLHWSGDVTKRQRASGSPAPWRYAMLLTNEGRRGAVAVTIQVRARVPMPLRSGSGSWINRYVFVIPTDTTFVPLIASHRPLLRRRRKAVRYPVVLRFAEVDPRDLAYAPLPEPVKERVRDGTVELEELLAHGLQLKYWAWGYDQATGAMSVASSPWIKTPEQVRPLPPA